MSAAEANAWRIPLTGPLCEGRCVSIGWPEDDEIDALTALRNRPQMRSKFLDSRALDFERNRAWIRSGMRRPFEALLAIRLKPSGILVGAIGWSHGDPGEGSFELGRVMVDAAVVQQHRRALPPDYAGVAVDAGTALRDFGFRDLGLSVMRSVFIADNRLSRRAALLGGARVVGTSTARRSDGTEVPVVRLELKRDEWQTIVAQDETPAPTRSSRARSTTAASAAPIPLFRPQVPAPLRRRLERALDSGWLGYGPECRALESTFTARRDGWALATSSCTSALYLAGRWIHASSDVADPEIIVPAVTFVASALAFLQAGVKPVLGDVDPESLLLGIDQARAVLSPRTRALLLVHLYGQRHPAVAELRAFADRHGLLLIEDCAHRIDLLDAASPLGDLTCYSFNAVKELPGGDGGLIWGSDPAAERCVREISNLGLTIDTLQRAATLRHADYGFGAMTGLKLRSNDVAASLVNAAIELLPEWRAQRREQFLSYDAALAALAPAIRPLARSAQDSCLMYVVKAPAALRERIRGRLAAAGIATSVHYPSLARHPLLRADAIGAGCDAQDECVMTLPTFLGLGEEGVLRIAAELERALALETAHSAEAPPADARSASRSEPPR